MNFCFDLMKRFVAEEEAMGVVEIILIIVVLGALVAVFKDEIEDLVDDIWDSIEESAETIY